MNAEHRTRFLSVSIFFLLIASAVFTVPARADSGSPPPAPTAPGGTTHIAAQLPSGVTNSGGTVDQGHKVELGSQNAAYLAQPSDPIWCPSTLAVPVLGGAGCTTPGPSNINYDPTKLDSLVAYLGNPLHQPGFNKNGTIWIIGGADGSTSTINMDGSTNFSTMANYSLTFKGGWTGLGGVIHSSNPSIISNTLNITEWTKNIALSDVQFNNVPGNPGRGLVITTQGNITLIRVQANYDNGWGAFLNNAAGGTGTVTITDSQFKGDNISNDSYALTVYSSNAITLTNVFVNFGNGAFLENDYVPNKPVTIKASSFDINKYNGLTVLSNGAITLTNVSASANFMGTSYGANLDNHNSTTAAPVILSGSNIFSSNAGYGLYVVTQGKITVTSIIASLNGGHGATLDNIYAAAGLPVTLLGNNSISSNSGDNLDINTYGAITINNLTSSGALFGNGAVLGFGGLPGNVTLTGTYSFNNNYFTGLTILAKGTVVTNNLTALNNGEGVYIDNTNSMSSSPVILKGHNTFSFNLGGGGAMTILSKGAVLTNNLTAIYNTGGGSGVTIDNHTSSIFSPVTLKGINTFEKNLVFGLNVISSGAVFTNNLIAMNNGGNGVIIENAGPSIAPVTLKGVNDFENNGGQGLDINSNGRVITNNLTALNNGSDGVLIVNNFPASIAPVLMNGINKLNNNGAYGLVLTSNGKITTNNLNASFNGTGGALIVNFIGTAGIFVGGRNLFWNNGFDGGLFASSNRLITISNISSKWNYGNGLSVASTGATNVIVSCGSFISNGTNHSAGYGWNADPSVLTIKLIGVTTAGNFSGDSHLANPGTLVTNIPHPCSLP